MSTDILSKAKSLFDMSTYINNEIQKLNKRAEDADNIAVIYKQAQVILQNAADGIQNAIRTALTSLCTAALKDVFHDKDVSFGIEFHQQKNATVVEMYIEEDGIRYDPLESRGHGMADLLTFALRVSVLALQPTLRKVLILDEPFTRISEEYRDRAIEFVKEVSAKTGVQIILVTHIPELARNADKVFNVKMVDGISCVTEQE